MNLPTLIFPNDCTATITTFSKLDFNKYGNSVKLPYFTGIAIALFWIAYKLNSDFCTVKLGKRKAVEFFVEP